MLSRYYAGGIEVKNASTATCGKDGYTGDTHCAGYGVKLQSGTVIPASGEHTYGGWAVTKEATATEKGEKQRVCSVCGHTETEELPALTAPTDPADPTDPAGTDPAGPSVPVKPADPSNPATGDSGILLLCTLLPLSVVGLAAAAPCKKRTR